MNASLYFPYGMFIYTQLNKQGALWEMVLWEVLAHTASVWFGAAEVVVALPAFLLECGIN